MRIQSYKYETYHSAGTEQGPAGCEVPVPCAAGSYAPLPGLMNQTDAWLMLTPIFK